MNPAPIRFRVFSDPMFAENAYVVYQHDGGPCWIVDPGLPPEPRQICGLLKELRLEPAAVVLTHAHADHIAGVDPLFAEIGQLPVYLGKPEWPMLSDAVLNLSAGMGMPITADVADLRDLPVGGQLSLGETSWVIGDVSGHSPGGRSFHCAAQKVVVVGDALFAGSVGRVDFPHSDGPTLLRNIRRTLLALPDDTKVLSGHGPATTIGAERRTNPFLLHGFD